jgi:hypothetical protein
MKMKMILVKGHPRKEAGLWVKNSKKIRMKRKK